MGLETGNYISDLNAANPLDGDQVAQSAAHLRLLKSVLKAQFPNLNGAVTVSDEELNYSLGLTSKIVDQLYAEIVARQNGDALKADIASPALTGVPTAPTAVAGTATTQIATTAFVAAQAFVSALPGQTGNAGKVTTTDGTNASWSALKTVAGVSLLGIGNIPGGLAVVKVSGTSQGATAGNDYWLENVAATAVTLSALPADGDEVAITPANGLTTNTVDSGAITVRGPAGTASGVITLNKGARMQLKYSSTITAWVMV